MHNPVTDTAGRSGDHRRKGEGDLLYQRVTHVTGKTGRVTAYLNGGPCVRWDDHRGCYGCPHAVRESELRRAV